MIVATLVALTTLSLTTHADASTVKVKTSDTVSGLAEKHHTSVGDIIKWNHLKDKNLIVVGDKLNIDGKNIKQIDQRKKTAKQHVVTVSQQSQQPVQDVQQYQAPVVQQSQPVQTQQNVPEPVKEQPEQPQSSSAKDQVAYIESRGDYNAQNGQFVGKYQLTASYLNGDYSEANQERVADKYVADRYGNWDNALAHEHAYGWY